MLSIGSKPHTDETYEQTMEDHRQSERERRIKQASKQADRQTDEQASRYRESHRNQPKNQKVFVFIPVLLLLLIEDSHVASRRQEPTMGSRAVIVRRHLCRNVVSSAATITFFLKNDS